MLPSILYINICICEHISLSFYILCLRFNFWKRSRLGGGGGVDLSSLLGVCGAMQNCHSEPKIHLAREDKGERGKDGDMRKGKKTSMRMRIGIVEGCRDGVEGVVLRSVLYCAFLSPLLGIIRSMNISLITAEKAEWSRVEDACHTAPSARITHTPLATLPCHTAPCLQLSTLHHLSLFPRSFP